MELHEIATDHLVTAAQAREIGYGPSELRAMVRRGEVRRAVRGWYAVSVPGERPPWEGDDRFESAQAWHRLRTLALLGSFDGRAVASHQSALVLHGVDVWRSDLSLVHLARVTDEHSRRRKGAAIHPPCGLPAMTAPGGHLTVPPAIAVAQVGMVAHGATPRLPLESLVAADSALHLGVVTTEDLEAALDVLGGSPGVAAVREVLAHADGRHESVGETRLMHGLRVLGYEVEPQVWITAGGRSYRVDGQLVDTPVLLEFDGKKKYLPGRRLSEEDEVAARRALAEEKRRQDDLAAAGHVVARFGWADLDSLQVIRAKTDAAIRQAAGLGHAVGARMRSGRMPG